MAIQTESGWATLSIDGLRNIGDEWGRSMGTAGEAHRADLAAIACPSINGTLYPALLQAEFRKEHHFRMGCFR